MDNAKHFIFHCDEGPMRDVISKLSYILDKRQKKKIVILFFITLISAFLEIIGVSLMIPIISAMMQPDIIVTNETIARVCTVLDLHSHRTFVIASIACLVFVFVVKNLFLVFQYYAQARFVCNNRFLTQQRLLASFLNRPYEYYLDVSTSEIMRVIQGDAVQVYELLTVLLFMGAESFVSLALLVTVFVIDWKMTSFVLIMMGLVVAFISKVIKPIMKRAGETYQKDIALSNKWLIQAVGGIKELKVSRKEDYFAKNYSVSGRELIHTEKINSVVNNVPRLLIEMISVCSMLTLIAIQILLGRDIESLVPTLGAFAMAAVKLMPSANRIVGAVNSIAYNQPALDKLIYHLKQVDEKNILFDKPESNRNDTIFAVNRAIELYDVSYRYPNTDKYVLKHAYMKILVGKSVGIIGSSGAGKTTAIDILLGLLKPEEGEVLVDGVNIMKNYGGWLSHIGYIPQMIFMLDESIRANIAFGVNPELIDDNKIWECLKEAQLDSFVKNLPDGLDTVVGERGVRLSGGQRQRIGIARALYDNPEVLLFDEATSSLDNETESAIMDSINSLHGKKTIVIIAHRLQTIEECDMVFRVHDGEIHAQ